MTYELSATAHDLALVRDGGTSYRLTGTVTATTTGWTVESHPLNEGIVPQPDLSRRLLHVIPPAEGDTVILVVTDIPLDEAFEDDAELERLHVELQGATTEDGGHHLDLTVD